MASTILTHVIRYCFPIQMVILGWNFRKETLIVMLLSTLVNGKGKFLLGLAEQFRLILLHDVEVVPLYLQQSCPQVAFKHKLNPLKFHLQYIDVESIICVATSSLGLFCYDFLLPQDHLLHLFHQSLLEG